MQASDVKPRPEDLAPEAGVAEQETAARLIALVRHLFRYDRGNQLRVLEETGLSLTQCKAMLELGGLGGSAEPWQVSDLAEHFGTSIPAMSRAVDALVKQGLATRVEDPDDRRVRRVTLTPKGQRLVDHLVTVRRAGTESFVATLTAAQRRKLDAAVDALMDREDIAQAYDLLKGSSS